MPTRSAISTAPVGPSSTVRQAALSVTDQAVVSLTTFVSGVVIGRLGSKEALGLYALGYTIVLIAANVQSALISTPYRIAVARRNPTVDSYYAGSTLIHQVAFSLALASALIGSASLLRVLATTSPLPSLLMCVAFAAPSALVREYSRQFCFAHFRFGQSALLDLGVACAQITILLVLGRYQMLTASTALIGSGIACGCVALVWLWAQHDTFKLGHAQSIAHLIQHWRLGKWMCASTVLMLLSNSLYPWLITLFHDATATGVFAACWSLVSLANPLLFGLGNFVGSRSVYALSAGQKALRSVVFNATLVFGSVALGVWLILNWIGDRLLGVLYGSSYAGNEMLIRLLAGSILLWAIGFSVEHGLLAVERPDLNFIVNLLGLGFTVTAGVCLVRSYGAPGAACSLVLLSGLTAALRHAAFNRASKAWRAPPVELSGPVAVSGRSE